MIKEILMMRFFILKRFMLEFVLTLMREVSFSLFTIWMQVQGLGSRGLGRGPWITDISRSDFHCIVNI